MEDIIAQVNANQNVSMRDIVTQLGLLQEHDEAVVQLAIEEVIKEQPAAVQDMKEGKDKVFSFLVGQVMKKAAGKAQPQKVQELLRKALEQ